MLTEDVASFDAFHFVPGQFDALLAAHGTDVALRLAMRCACWNADSGRPDPACTLCFPFGFLFDAPVTVRAYGPNRKPTRRVDTPGSFEVGDAFFTFPTGVKPTYFSRLVLPTSEILVDETLTKGSEDTIRFSHVLGVEKAHATRRNPPTGHPYVTEVVPLTLGTDFTLSGRTIVWPGGSTHANGTRYVLRLRTLEEYVVWETQTRNENGQDLPWRCLCKRVDFLTHPKAPAELTY